METLSLKEFIGRLNMLAELHEQLAKSSHNRAPLTTIEMNSKAAAYRHATEMAKQIPAHVPLESE